MTLSAPLRLVERTQDLGALAAAFVERAAARKLTVAVMGLGYVGLPLSEVLVNAGFPVVGFDVDAEKVARIAAGGSHISCFESARVQAMAESGRFEATSEARALARADAILICVPTPVNLHRAPDLSFVEAAGESIAPLLRPGQLVVLESTTFPGATGEVLRPILERSGLTAGRDFALAYSPEREDPGNAEHSTGSIPKVVGADTAPERDMALALYGAFTQTVPVSDLKTAEAVKISENIFRLVNIALANELNAAFGRLGIDSWEVVRAAATKPFGYMPFHPGPGIGGHCIPVDPFYLTWKARACGAGLPLVELAGEIAGALPRRVVEATAAALSDRLKLALNGARVLVVGVAYKRNIDDVRESPGVEIIELLAERGAEVDYHDRFVPVLQAARGTRRSIAWTHEGLGGYDCAVLVTDHADVDYASLLERTPLIVDTRNGLAHFAETFGEKIVKP